MAKSGYSKAMKSMLVLYVNILVRFALYGLYGYAVALAIVYGYNYFVDASAPVVWNMKESCNYSHCAMTIFGLIAMFFAVRDGVWACRKKLVAALQKMDPKL